jgi:hypothetical protein
MRTSVTYFLLIALCSNVCAYSSSPPQPLPPGKRFRMVVKWMKGNSSLYIQDSSELASEPEASLIRLLGDIASQCMQVDQPKECDFKPTQNAKLWPELVPYLKHHLSRGEYYALGALFQCSVRSLENYSESEYLDCLKMAELHQLSMANPFK